jgi:hypothetical protein
MNASTLNRPNAFSFIQRAAVSFADWAGWLNFVDRGMIEQFKATQSWARRN